MAAERREYQGGAVPTVITGAVADTDMSFTLSASSGWPTGSVGPFLVVIDPSTSREEKIQCASRSGTIVTVATGGRGFDGTTAQDHATNAVVKHALGATDIDLANDHAATTTRDDHSQYVHNSTARTVSANHTFSGNPVFSGTPSFTGVPELLGGALIGSGAAGSGTYAEISDESDTGAYFIAKGDTDDVPAIVRSKGDGTVQLQDEDGNVQLRTVTEGNGLLDTAIVVQANTDGSDHQKRVYVGAADSGGSGYRSLRVDN